MVGSTAWTWRYEDPSGETVVPMDTAPTAEQFPNQADAETWIGEHWRELLAAGVKLDADLMARIDEVLEGVVTTDPAKTESPRTRP